MGYVTHVASSGQVLRWCVITTQNGFAVTGKPSASVSKENDNEEIGKSVAYDNARSELWPLMGYALKESLYKAPERQPGQRPSERSGAASEANEGMLDWVERRINWRIK